MHSRPLSAPMEYECFCRKFKITFFNPVSISPHSFLNTRSDLFLVGNRYIHIGFLNGKLVVYSGPIKSSSCASASALDMEKVKLSRKRNPCDAVMRGPNHAYIPHHLPPKSQETSEPAEDQSNVVPPLLRKRKTFTPSEVDAHFRAIIAKEPVPALNLEEPAPTVKPKRISKPRRKTMQSQNIKRLQQVTRKSITPRCPRLPVKVVRAANTTGTLARHLLPKSIPPAVIPESGSESTSEDASLTPNDPTSIPLPESEADSVSGASQTPDEPKSTQGSEAESISENEVSTPETGVAGEPGDEPVDLVPTVPQPLILLGRRVCPLQCEICGKILNSRPAKCFHKKTHNPPEFFCPVQGCSMKFVRKFNFQSHQARHMH